MKKQFLYLRIFVYSFLLAYVSGCCKTEQHVWLDEIEFKKIINQYGAPKRNSAFPGTKININGQRFERGLGLHAPARLNIDLNNKALSLTAFIGIDSAKYHYHSQETLDSTIRKNRHTFPADYVYDNKANHHDFTKGGTAILKILLDGKEVYNSGIMKAENPPEKIQLSLKNAKTLSIIANPTEDGSFTDFIDIAEAKIAFHEIPEELAIYNYPKSILVNHVGFHPKAQKTCYMHGTRDTVFELVSVNNKKTVFKGKMIYVPGNLGEYLVGDFSAFTAPGYYYLVSGSKTSEKFKIDKNILKNCLNKHLYYLEQQRSGHPEKGWNPGQHLDDGIRDDNKKHQDVSGGWYDASDIRKPTSTNAMLVFALAKMALSGQNAVPASQLIEEIKWGNKFLFAMQEPEGYLMSSLAFGSHKTKDNKWTDNIKGTKDDRYIQTKPEDFTGQLYFIVSELMLARYFLSIDPTYANKCFLAAKNCYNWVFDEKTLSRINEITLAIMAQCEMYRHTDMPVYKEKAEKWLDKLMEYKYSDPSVPITLFAKTSRGKWSNFHVEHINDALHNFIKTFPESEKNKICLNTMNDYCRDFFIQLQNKNAFHLMPWFLLKDSSFSSKSIDGLYYRNFLHVGLNRNITLNAYDMLNALNHNNNNYVERAQQQLDWVFGANPFNASSVTGMGYNHPSPFRAGDYAYTPPQTPEITGGVFTGIGADKDDNPALYPGWWWTTEYWAPTVAAVILLENSLNNFYEK